ncbi:hypothetical protein JB92DRAFT_2832957 [Gautieria morchelliformis]|nr:hypothetical protein JB92DRAFT_2832957 [Gautieria morchelliformis]
MRSQLKVYAGSEKTTFWKWWISSHCGGLRLKLNLLESSIGCCQDEREQGLEGTANGRCYLELEGAYGFRVDLNIFSPQFPVFRWQGWLTPQSSSLSIVFSNQSVENDYDYLSKLKGVHQEICVLCGGGCHSGTKLRVCNCRIAWELKIGVNGAPWIRFRVRQCARSME